MTTLALRCSQAAGSGRRVTGGFKKRETMPQRGVTRNTPARIPLRDIEHGEVGWLSDALREDVRTPVPRRVAFKLDFVPWRAALTEKRRKLLDALAAGGR